MSEYDNGLPVLPEGMYWYIFVGTNRIHGTTAYIHLMKERRVIWDKTVSAEECSVSQFPTEQAGNHERVIRAAKGMMTRIEQEKNSFGLKDLLGKTP